VTRVSNGLLQSEQTYSYSGMRRFYAHLRGHRTSNRCVARVPYRDLSDFAERVQEVVWGEREWPCGGR
jgi:hypothetical protein